MNSVDTIEFLAPLHDVHFREGFENRVMDAISRTLGFAKTVLLFSRYWIAVASVITIVFIPILIHYTSSERQIVVEKQYDYSTYAAIGDLI